MVYNINYHMHKYHHLFLLFLITILLQTTYEATCPSYRYYDNATSSCQSCSYSCVKCTSSQDCTLCDRVNDKRVLINQRACMCIVGYYDDRVSTVCKDCNSTIPNCVDCFFNSTYASSDAGLGALQKGCFACREGYVLLNNACNLIAICPFGQGPDLTTSLCRSCSIGCLTCSSDYNNCTSCNNTANYFINDVTASCILCQLFVCATCRTLTECQTCNDGFILLDGQCGCGDGQYLNIYTGICQSCSKYCVTCTGPSSYQCKSCNSSLNRYLVGSQCQCDDQYFQQSTTGTTCTKIDTTLCSRGYVKVQTLGQCVQLCGDGWRIGYECDDGNVINTDGCSDECKLQTGYSCLNLGTASSICRMISQVKFESIKIQKDKVANVLYFTIDISPDSVVYNYYDLTTILHFRGGLLSLFSASYDNGYLYITANYTQVMQGKSVQLQIKQDYQYDQNYPEDHQTLYNTTKATFSLSTQFILLNTSNNLKPNAYTQQVYAQAANTNKGAIAVMAIAIIVSLGSLFIKNSLSVIINVNALQISYISMVSIRGMHPITTALLQIRPALGYNNLQLFQLNGQQTSVRVASIGFVEDFANNFNVMFFVQCAFLLASVLTNLASDKKPIIKLASSILQRQAFLLIVFNLPTIFFTITLMIKPIALNLVFCILAGVVIIYQLAHLLIAGPNYFGFKECFDFTPKGNFKKFIVVYFLCRLGSCLSFSFISVDPLKSLIAGAAFEGAFIIFISFVRPFYHSLNNIFMILAEIMTISFFGNVYSSESTDSMTYNDRQKSISVMAYLIGAISIVATVNFIYSLIIDIKQGGKKLKAFNQLIEAKQKADKQQSFN